MRKSLLATLLVAILASSMVFAGFSGNATVGAFYDFDTNYYGMSNGTSVNFDLALGTEDVDKKAEGDIYASIKATLSLAILDTDADGVSTGNPIGGANSWSGVIVKPIAKISEAKVGGENWYVSILGTINRLDLAKSAIDTWTVENEKDDYGRLKANYTDNASYAVANNKAPGVEVNYAGYSLAFGGISDKDGKAITVHAKTPEIALMDGLTLQAGAAFNKKKTETEKNIGGSVKVAYAKDPLTLSVATDMGYTLEAKEFNADVAAQAKYDFVTVDAYYATNVKVKGIAIKNLLSTKASFDLAKFDLPLTVKVTAKNLINNKSQDISGSVAYKADTYAAEVGGGYNLGTEVWNVYAKGNVDVSVFNIFAGLKVAKAPLNDAKVGLMPFVGAKTTKLIPGATLTASWIGDDFGADVLAKKYGKFNATCKIAF